MALIGLDIGTTGCKSHIFSDELKLLASASREYSVDIPHPLWAEQDAENVWRLARECLRESIQKANVQNSVQGISFSVQGEAVTPVDHDGKALRPMILGMDTRTGAQNDQLKDKFGARELFNLTGMPVQPFNTLPKLLWLKQNEPEIWKQADKFLLYEDFICNKMTGESVISQCLASRTQYYDLHKKDWSKPILAFLGLTPNRLARLQPSGTPVAVMKAELAEELGLKTQPLVASGGHDQSCGALGAGLTIPGLAMVSTGTAEVVEVSMDNPHLNDHLFQTNMSVYQHTYPGLFVVMTLNQSGGFVLRWFRDMFCQKEMELAADNGKDAYDLIFQNIKNGPSPVMMLPHLSGSGSPTFDALSKGAFTGITFATTKGDFAKAILEGLTMELRINLELLQQGGITINQLRGIGGGAKSAIWLQLKADITGIPVAAPEVTEAAGMGAAILAGMAAGIFTDAASAIKNFLTIRKIYEPNLSNKTRYDDRYQLHKQFYPALKEINHTL